MFPSLQKPIHVTVLTWLFKTWQHLMLVINTKWLIYTILLAIFQVPYSYWIIWWWWKQYHRFRMKFHQWNHTHCWSEMMRTILFNHIPNFNTGITRSYIIIWNNVTLTPVTGLPVANSVDEGSIAMATTGPSWPLNTWHNCASI